MKTIVYVPAKGKELEIFSHCDFYRLLWDNNWIKLSHLVVSVSNARGTSTITSKIKYLWNRRQIKTAAMQYKQPKIFIGVLNCNFFNTAIRHMLRTNITCSLAMSRLFFKNGALLSEFPSSSPQCVDACFNRQRTQRRSRFTPLPKWFFVWKAVSLN